MEAPDSSPAGGGEIGSRIGVRFYRYRAVLKRYWWILLICMGVGLAYEAFVIFTKPTRYVSVGKLSIRETRTDENSMAQIMNPSWFGTVIKTIESPAVNERARKSAEMERPGSGPAADQVQITADNETNTFFFAVKGVGPNPEFTAYYVDRVMEAFMESRRDDNRLAAEQDLKRYEEQQRKEKEALESAQKEVQKFTDKEAVPFVEQRALEISAALADHRKDLEIARGELSFWEHIAPGTVPLTNAGGGTKTPGANDPRTDRWMERQQELAMKENELKTRSEIWKPDHPRYKNLQEEIRQLKAAISNLEKLSGADRDANIARLKNQIELKNQSIAAAEQQARDFSKILTVYKNLQAEVDRQLTNYNHTREMLDKLRLAGSTQEILSIQQKASAPVEENRGVIKGLLTGLIGGLLLGMGILFLVDRADDRLASSSEMIEQFDEPILGQIPDVADSRTNEGLPLLQEEDERYMYAEAFRSLRSSLIFMPNQTELKTLIITSAIPNEGKSTIASNLAITMANAGARVLLVDADLRRGDIAALFDTDGRQGLANIIRGEVSWRDCVKSLRGDKLHIIPRGPVTNQSGELLLQPTLPKLLAEWKAGYDLVIFNTAPILATDDTPTLAPNFDGTLMVIRASFTSARLTRNALNALYQRQVNVLGLIMNCVDTEMPDYYYYRYPKYYSV
jgi:capsular exopolysaccharide synthesis family protein